VTLSPSICKTNCLRLLIPKVLRDALWLVTKYGHMATYGHGRNHPGESQRDRATPLWNICPTTLPVVAGSDRHVHLIDAGIHVQDETVHAPAGLCADKDCETIPLLKWRLDRYVLKTGRVSGVRATAATVARTTRRFAGASTTRSTTRVSTGSQGAAVIEETKENHESSCLPRHERCQR